MNHTINPVDMLEKNAEYLVAAYGYFELKLRNICARQAGISGPLDAAEARKLLKHHSDVRFPDDKTWQELMMLKKIRNVLLHSAGRIEERNLLEHCRKRGVIRETDGAHFIEATPAYKNLVRSTVIKFFEDFRVLNENN